MKVKGKKESVYIFEIMDAEWSKESQLKIAQRKKFSQAIEAYRRKEFVFASDLFTEILNENPNDGASKLYLSRCQKNEKHSSPSVHHNCQSTHQAQSQTFLSHPYISEKAYTQQVVLILICNKTGNDLNYQVKLQSYGSRTSLYQFFAKRIMV